MLFFIHWWCWWEMWSLVVADGAVADWMTEDEKQCYSAMSQNDCSDVTALWGYQDWSRWATPVGSCWTCVILKGLPRWWGGKESTCQCRRCRFDPCMGKIPWSRKKQLTPVSLPGKSQSQRSPVGYSPWRCKESNMTERLSSFTIFWKKCKKKKKKFLLCLKQCLEDSRCSINIYWLNFTVPCLTPRFETRDPEFLQWGGGWLPAITS